MADFVSATTRLCSTKQGFVDDERPPSVNWRELDEADRPHEHHVSLMDQVVVRANMRDV